MYTCIQIQLNLPLADTLGTRQNVQGHDLGHFQFIRSGQTGITGSCQCKWEAKVHSSQVRMCELYVLITTELDIFCTTISNIRYWKLPHILHVVCAKTWKLYGSTQRARPVQPEPVLPVLRTDLFHLRTGWSHRPVLINMEAALRRQ